jgi:dTDP-4-dehydrorhamnose reductase
VKVLVTGAGGMLAQALIPALERREHDVLPLSREDADVSTPGALLHPAKLFEPDWIVNLSAFTRVDECESEVDQAYRVNALGARNAAIAAAAHGAAILTMSTDYVFDGTAQQPYREYDVAAPRSVYGASKWAGEQAVREVHPRHLIVRTAWLYGRGGINFVDTMLRKARAGDHLHVVDDQHGSPTWTEDLAPALVKLIEADQVGTLHVTNSGSCSWYDLAAHALSRAAVPHLLDRTSTASLARPAQRPAYSVLNNQLFELVTGERLPEWKSAVDRYLAAVSAAEADAANV